MLKKIFSNEFGRATMILFIAINIFNVLNFIFHFLMGRMLGPENYGILAVLMSFVYIYGIPSEAIQNIVTNYTSKLNAKKQKGKIKFLMMKFLKRGFRLSFLLFFLAVILSMILSKFLRINFWLIFITNFYIFFSFSIPTARGVLQGRKKFISLGGSLVTESALKIFFSVSFVIFGFALFGAVAGILMGFLASLVFSLYFNKEIIESKEEVVKFDHVYLKSVPYFITMVVILLMLSLDIILAKRFFEGDLVGKYAVVSILGKMIYFATIGIGMGMFPLTTQNHEEKKDTFKIFKKALGIIFFLCAIAVSIYFFFPKLVIGILYGSQYLEFSNLLVYSGIGFSFLSMSNLILLYGLSTNRLNKSYLLLIFLLVEIVLLSTFHKTLLEYTIAFMVSNTIMFIGGIFLILKWRVSASSFQHITKKKELKEL